MEMFEAAGNPPLLFFDARPVTIPFICIGSHELAEQITRQTDAMPYSWPKSPTMRFLKPLLGDRSMIIAQVRSSHSSVPVGC